MEISKTRDGNKTVFNLSGRLDTKTSPRLLDVLVPEFDASEQIELNFSELIYISSAGLRVLLIGEKTADAKNAELTVTNVSRDIMEILEMTGFASTLRILYRLQ